MDKTNATVGVGPFTVPELSIGTACAWLVAVIALAILVRYVVIPLISKLSPEALMRLVKSIIGEIRGEKGLLGRLNIIGVVLLALLSAFVFQGERGPSIKEVMAGKDPSAPTSIAYCTVLSIVVTALILAYSLRILSRHETKVALISSAKRRRR